MKSKLHAFSRRYRAALQEHLRQDSLVRPAVRSRLGQEALALGLDTLDLARIHEVIMATLALPNSSSGMNKGVTRRAAVFFSQSNLAIEKTHFAAVKSITQLQQRNEVLRGRTQKLLAARRELKRGIVQRKAAQKQFERSKHHSSLLLMQSRNLQAEMRRITRQLFATQEAERKKISRDLHDKVAQTLLGINIRLITLKREAVGNRAEFQENIMETQRLVEKSLKTLLRLAREFMKTSTATRRIDSEAKSP